MLRAYIMDKYPEHVFFATDKRFKDLLVAVLTRIAAHQIIIDDCIETADTDIFNCHSGIGDFTVYYDGDIDIWTPSPEFAKKLLLLFNQ